MRVRLFPAKTTLVSAVALTLMLPVSACELAENHLKIDRTTNSEVQDYRDALSPREAWRVTLDDGVVLDLGRDQPKHPAVERLARFAQAYPVLRTRLQTPFQVVDMRYPNGFALRFGGKPS